MHIESRSSRRPFGKTFGLLSIGVISLAFAVAPARADSCIEQVEDLAGQYGLSTDLPDAATQDTPDAPVSDDLAQSGGLIKPPADPDSPEVIDPPQNTQPATPTLPDATPGPQTEGGAAGLSSADLVLLESILVGARAEAERGDEVDCFNRLSRARDFIAGRNAGQNLRLNGRRRPPAWDS